MPMTDADAADLQAQVVALRIAVEGAWLSLLSPDPDPVGTAQRLGEQHVDAVRGLQTVNANAKAAQDAIVHHTEQLWGSIAWQLAEARKGEAEA